MKLASRASSFQSVWALLPLLAILQTACDSSRTAQRQHPAPEFEVQPASARVHLIDRDTADNRVPSEYRRLWKRLLSASVIATMGVLDRPEEAILGRVRSAAFAPEGELVIVDDRRRAVLVYDLEGHFVQAVAGPGEGPGELRGPTAMIFDHDGRLLVLDPRDGIEVFSRQEGSYRFEGVVRSDLHPFDLCTLGDALYLHAVDVRSAETPIIHRFSLNDGKVTASFGTSYDYNNPRVVWHMSRGRIVCAEAEGLVIHAPALASGLRAYRPDGSLAWVSRLTDSQPLEILELPDRIRQTVPEQGFDYLLAVTYLGPGTGFLMVQTAFVTREGWEAARPFDQIHTYLIDVRTGQGLYVGDDFSTLLAVTSDLVATVGHSRHPTVTVRRLPTHILDGR